MTVFFSLLAVSILLNLLVLCAIVYLYFVEKKDMGGISRAVRSTKRIKTKSAKMFETEAEDELSQLVKGYVHELSSELKEHLSGLTEVAEKQSADLAQFVREQQRAVISETQTLVANNIVKIEKELEEYKKNQFERIESEINSIVASTASKVLGRMVSLTEHEDLVRQALERAKKDKFFA